MVGTPKRPAGKSIVVPKSNDKLKSELAKMKQELLVELAKILGEVKAAQVLGYPAKTAEQDNDTPVFIPTTIGTGDNVDTEINIEDTETDSDTLDDAAQALKEMKRKNKENK